MNDLSARIRELRLAAGLSAAEVARKLKISQTAYGKIDDGRTANPKIETLVQLADLFKMTVSELIRDPGWTGRYETAEEHPATVVTTAEPAQGEAERQLVTIFRQADAIQQDLILRVVHQLVQGADRPAAGIDLVGTQTVPSKNLRRGGRMPTSQGRGDKRGDESL